MNILRYSNLGILLTLTEHFATFRATFPLQKLQKSQQCFQKFFIGIQNVFSSLHTIEHYRIAFWIPRICDTPLISKEMTLMLLSRTYSIHLSDAFS